jgi:hypothetical protein
MDMGHSVLLVGASLLPSWGRRGKRREKREEKREGKNKRRKNVKNL